MHIATQRPLESGLNISIRTVFSVFTGALFTFALFVLMNQLIAEDDVVLTPVKPTVFIDPVFEEPDEKTIERPRIKPIPKTHTMPETRQELPEQQLSPNGPAIAIDTPETPRVEILGPSVFGSSDGDSRPIVRVDPRYPVDAARDGVEGWVKMRFDINAMGGVNNIRVIESQPARTFEKEAKRALSKWKYKPKVQNGIAVSQADQTVVLEFTLAGN